MKITLTGSLGNISRVLVERLTKEGHEVRVISSDAGKVTEIEKLHAIPSIGSLVEGDFMLEAFQGADAVYTMVPPDFSVGDYYVFADTIHQNYAQAIEQNKIKYAVNLSSVGVAFAGQAPLTRYYDLEKKLNHIPGLNVVHLRPAMFYTNFYGSLPMVRHQGIIGHNVGGNTDLLMTHPSDIADAAFLFLHSLSFQGQQIIPIISDVKSGHEIAEALGHAINKRLHWIEFSDEQLLGALLQNGFSEDTAKTLIVAAGKAIRDGLFDEFKRAEYRLPESRKFSEFATTFARVYQASM